MKKEWFIKLLFESFFQNNIDYFVYGEYSALPENTGGSDIDIIIDDKDLKQVKRIIEKIYKSNGIILGSFYTNPTSLFYRFITVEWGVQIDIFFKGFIYKGIEYYPKQNIIRDIISHNDINVLRINKAYYIGFLKEVIHLGKAKDKYINGFIKEINSNIEYYKEEIDRIYGSKTKDVIFNNLEFENLKVQCKIIRENILNNFSNNKKCTVIGNKISLIKRLFQTRPGYVIAILGTDGSGKSTIINNISPILNEGFHNGIIYNHLRPNVIPDLGVVMGKKKKADEVKVVSNPHSEKQSGLVGSLVRWGYYMIDYTLGYLKDVYPVIHTRSKIFIFDRYYYDYYIDQKRSKTNLPKWIIKFGEFFLPKPDIILCLGGDPEKIYNRKPETSLEEVRKQTNALEKFCNNHKNAVWIDTCTDIHTSTNEAMNAICNIMAKRFSNFRFK